MMMMPSARFWLRSLAAQVRANLSRTEVHLSFSVRTSSPGVEAAWAWCSSTQLSGSGSSGSERSAVALEALALADALEHFPGRKVIAHCLTEPVAALAGTLPQMEEALERHRSRPRSAGPFARVDAASLALRSFELVPPGTPCTCDRLAAQALSRAFLRTSYPMPSVLPAQRLSVEDEDVVQVATDGSCDHVVGVGGWAWYVSEDEWDSGILTGVSSSAMEIEAVIAALGTLPSSTIEVVSDCHALVLGINRLAAGSPVRSDAADIEQWERLATLMDGRQVFATWVRSHNGHEANTFADVKARSAMRAAARGMLAAEALLAPDETAELSTEV